MDEVDKIGIQILQDVGVELPKDVETFEDFSSALVVSSVSAALAAINEQLRFPAKLPPSKAARFRITSKISKAIKELGYTGEIGYQTLLYPNVADTRQLIMFLTNKIPKPEEEAAEEEVLGASQLLNIAIKDSLKAWKSARYSLFKEGRSWGVFRTTNVNTPSNVDDPDVVEYCENDLPRGVQAQIPHPGGLLPTIVHQNCVEVARLQSNDEALGRETEDDETIEEQRQQFKELVTNTLKTAVQQAKAAKESQASSFFRPRNSNVNFSLKTSFENETNFFSRAAQFASDKGVATAEVINEEGNIQQVTETGELVKEEEELEQDRAAKLAEAQKKQMKLQRRLGKIITETEKQKGKAKEFEETLKTKEEEEKKLTEAYKTKSKALDLLPNAKENEKKLREILEKSETRVANMKKQWEDIKSGMLDKLSKRTTEKGKRKADAKMKVEQLKEMRRRMREMGLEIREKDATHKQLVAEVNKLPRTVNRQHYVKRIMDIGRTLEKQKKEIRTILRDVRQVQSEKERLTNTAARVFSVVDDMIYQKAQNTRDKSAARDIKSVYRSVVAMRDSFNELLEKIADKGEAKKEMTATERRIDQLEERIAGENLTRVLEDLSAVKQENKAITAKIKA